MCFFFHRIQILEEEKKKNASIFYILNLVHEHLNFIGVFDIISLITFHLELNGKNNRS